MYSNDSILSFALNEVPQVRIRILDIVRNTPRCCLISNTLQYMFDCQVYLSIGDQLISIEMADMDVDKLTIVPK